MAALDLSMDLSGLLSELPAELPAELQERIAVCLAGGPGESAGRLTCLAWRAAINDARWVNEFAPLDLLEELEPYLPWVPRRDRRPFPDPAVEFYSVLTTHVSQSDPHKEHWVDVAMLRNDEHLRDNLHRVAQAACDQHNDYGDPDNDYDYCPGWPTYDRQRRWNPVEVAPVPWTRSTFDQGCSDNCAYRLLSECSSSYDFNVYMPMGAVLPGGEPSTHRLYEH